MATLDDVVTSLQAASRPDNELGMSVRLDLDPAGSVFFDGAKVWTEQTPVDLAIGMKLEDFVSIVNGEIDPGALYLQGKLSFSDADLASTLQWQLIVLMEGMMRLD